MMDPNHKVRVRPDGGDQGIEQSPGPLKKKKKGNRLEKGNFLSGGVNKIVATAKHTRLVIMGIHIVRFLQSLLILWYGFLIQPEKPPAA